MTRACRLRSVEYPVRRMAMLAGAIACLVMPTPSRADSNGLSDADLRLLNRVTWGANPSSAEALRRMGREKWLEWQLHPTAADTLPPAAQAQIDAMAISQRSMQDMVAEMNSRGDVINQTKDQSQRLALAQSRDQAMNDLSRQAASRQIMRDLYAPSQLREQMTWFWFNHFNVHQYKANLRPMVADYEEHALRDHALGRFRDLLAATVRHPAMLRYLDNSDSAAGHINENYAREIMELHTLGVGSGYTQADVQELARILTGMGIEGRLDPPKLKPELQAQVVRDGLFEFNPARHDHGDKMFLGHAIKGGGIDEVNEAIDILARAPATARHVSTEMAIYFLGDTPPPALVQQMAETFQRTDGDIAAVLGVLFHAPAFADPAAMAETERFKDPMHYVISAVRLAYDDRVILNAAPIQNWLNRMSEGLYNKDTPDGYAMTSSAWNGPGQLATRFEIARQIGSGSAGLFKPDTPGATDRPGFPQLQNALYFGGLQHTLAPATRAALSDAISPQDWNTLFLSSPEFMY